MPPPACLLGVVLALAVSGGAACAGDERASQRAEAAAARAEEAARRSEAAAERTEEAIGRLERVLEALARRLGEGGGSRDRR